MPRIAAIEIVRLKVEEIRPHPRNPRSHPKPGSKEWLIVQRSLENAYFDPLVWNRKNHMLISGHLRWRVLQEMGFDEVDVSAVECDEETHYALMIHANRHQGEFDTEILTALLAEIETAGLDAALAGFDHKAMMAMLEPPKIEDDTEQTAELVSKAEKLLEKWKVKEGDCYQIGSHRLLCGCCESPDNWQALLGDGLADMMWTDPPYNVAYDASQKKRLKLKKQEAEKAKPNIILNDNLSAADYEKSLNAWFSTGSNRLKAGGAVYIAHADAFGLETRAAAKAAGFNIAQCLVWVKQAWTLGRQDYQWQHEPILYGWKTGAGHHWQGGYSQSTVIDGEPDLKKLSKAELISLINHMRNGAETTVIREPRNVCSDLHPTVKPTRLVARHIWNSSRRGEMVMELFGGSGTTLAAAEQTGRRCVATELDPKFASVILERMSLLGLQVEKLNGNR